jgi:hypothetical protein
VKRLGPALAIVLLAGTARAQSAPQMQVQVDTDTVGVGDAVVVEMSATSGETMPSDPQLGASAGFAVRGQNASPSQTHISINGNRSDRYTLTVDWTLQASKVGTYTVGPPSVVLGRTRFSGRAVTVHVLPAGQAPPRRQAPQAPSPFPFQFQFSPFDPWRNMMQPPPDVAPAQPSQVTADPKLGLDAPRGQAYFLHATVDKTSAVVGEAVVFSVYEYIDAGATNVEVDDEDVHDAAVPDFVKRPLLKEDQAPLSGYASVGGHTWIVKLVRRWALFPLRAGDLDIGPMSVGMLRPRAIAGAKRTSEPLRIHVSEPPLAGRPPGYAVGDVGHFSISSQVAPRSAQQGGAVGVHVEVSGKGNVPNAIAAPVQNGVEWLAPEVHDEVGPIGQDAYGGKRSFDYVVRIQRSGDVELGDVALPFWDPDLKRYDIARAHLGGLQVSPAPAAAATAAPAEAERETLPGLPEPRDVLEGTPAARPHRSDSLALWIVAIIAGPLSFGAAVAFRAAARRLSAWWRGRQVSPARDLRERIAAAHAACAKGDGRGADAAIARALEAATVAYTGVSVRGAIGGEVEARLQQSGVTPDAAKGVADLLRECEAARFSPDAVDTIAAQTRWKRAQGAIRQLEKRG